LSTSTLTGTVVDQSGPVPGATISAVNTQTGFRYQAVAGTNGGYQIAGLQPGTYKISVSFAPAYKEQTRTVQILVGQTITADFKLAVDAVYTESMTVIGSGTPVAIETKTSEVSTNITQQQIRSLPLNNRNFLAFAQLAPGVSFTKDNDAAGQTFTSGAQNAKQVNVFIDGVSFKNDIIKGGAFMQDSSRGNPFPQGAVQEYKVLTQNYKAEYDKAAAAVITAVTKSGGNKFDGEAFYLYQNKGMVELDTFAKARGDKKPSYSRNQYGVSLGGPIIADKLNFFITGERNKRDVVASVFRGTSWDRRPPNLASLLDPYPVGTIAAPLDEKLYFGKMSLQASASQLADLSYHRRSEKEIRGFGGARVQEGASNFKISTDNLNLHHQLVLGPNAINEATGTFQKQQWIDSAVDPSKPHLNYANLLDIGGKDYQQNLQQKRTGIRDDLSYYTNWHGGHALKAGVVLNKADYNMTKSAFGTPYFEFRQNENWQFPFLARYGFGNPTLKFGNNQYGIYAQDDWTIDKLTVNAGVRWDYETNMLNNSWVTPPDVVAGLQTACRHYDKPVGGKSDWCIRDIFNINDYISTGNNRSSYKGMVQPRLGLSWDPVGDAKTVLFGGWGLYYDRVTLNDIFDEQYRHSFKQYTFCFTDQTGKQPEGCGVPAIKWDPAYQSAAGLAGLIARGQTPGPEIFLLSNSTKPPRTVQYTAGVRHQITPNLLGSLSYGATRGRNGLVWSFGAEPPGTAFNDRWGGWVQIPKYGFIMRSFTARRTKYDAIYLTLDRPRTSGSRWGANVAYTLAKGSQNASLDDGTAFAFDFLPANGFPMFPANGDERHRLVMSGSIALPANFEASSIINLSSGSPFTYTNCLAGWDKCVTYFNGGKPAKESFLGIKQFGYRNVDARLSWSAPSISRAQISLIAEAFNILNFKNYSSFEGWAGAPGEPNPKFMQPTAAFNARRFQFGTRVTF
jgi:hypothetical protein